MKGTKNFRRNNLSYFTEAILLVLTAYFPNILILQRTFCKSVLHRWKICICGIKNAFTPCFFSSSPNKTSSDTHLSEKPAVFKKISLEYAWLHPGINLIGKILFCS